MTKSEPDLSAIRNEIDELDKSLHELLMRRAEIIKRVKVAKTGSDISAYRPRRESEVLKQLVERHSGKFPVVSIYRIWREIMAASVVMQDKFSCAVWDGNNGIFRTIARNHFGAVTPLHFYSSPVRVLNAVSQGETVVGLLPMPQQDDLSPWWPSLYGSDINRVAICGSVPRYGFEIDAGAIIVGNIGLEESSLDNIYLIIETDGSLSQSGLRNVLKRLDLEIRSLFQDPMSSRVEGRALFLAKIKGFGRVIRSLEADILKISGAVKNVVFIGTSFQSLKETE